MEHEETGLSRRTLLAGTGMAAVAATGLRHAAVAAPRSAKGAARPGGQAWQVRLTLEVAGTTLVADGVALVEPSTKTPEAFAVTVPALAGEATQHVTYAEGTLLVRGAAPKDLTVSWGTPYRGTGDKQTTEVPFRTPAGTGRLSLLAALPDDDAERLAAVVALGNALSPTRAS